MSQLQMEDLTIEEREIFDEFKIRVKEFIEDDFMLAEDDVYLHFLIKWKFDIEEAVKEIREGWDLAWALNEEANKKEHLEVFHCKKYLPYGHCGYAKNGAFVWYARTGCCDVNGIWKSAGREGVFNYPFQAWEEVYDYVKTECLNRGMKRYRFIAIIDLEGFPLWALTKYEYLKFAFDLKREYGKFLPPTTAPCVDAVYVINFSKIFLPGLKFAKSFAPYQVCWEKVHFYGGKKDYLPAILEKIDIDQIPRHWGGTREGDDEYCSELICPGGPVPEKYYLKNKKK